MPHSKNRILSGIRPADLRALQPHLRLVELEHGLVIAHSRQRVHQVYFPHGGILSCIVEAARPSAILRVHDFRCWRALETCPPILRMSIHRRILLQKSFCGMGGLRAAGAAIEK